MRTQCTNVEFNHNCSWSYGAHPGYVVRRKLEGPFGHQVGRVDCVYYAKFRDHKWDACHIVPTS